MVATAALMSTGPRKLSLSDLPTELHAKILYYLPWKSHIPCMQVCTRWLEILCGDCFKDARYIDVYQPRYHRLFTEPDPTNLRILKFTLSGKEVGAISIASHPAAGNMVPSLDDLEDKVLEELELRQDGILADNLFYHKNVRILSEEDRREYTFEGSIDLEIEGIKLSIQCIDPDSGTNKLDKKEYLSLNETPEFSEMTLKGFLTFVAEFATKDEFLKDYKTIDMELGVDSWPVSNTEWFYLRLKNIEWADGRSIQGHQSVYGQEAYLEEEIGGSEWEISGSGWNEAATAGAWDD
ncbi:hypothetical protein TWF694_006934 [Orbilia ellipsospora]|uniref:F-box domain-containing protein n=1 Tax=Orbilia ellipsospora TaxID=2528407 RepID=A0AAV9XTE0_9PEZI